MSSGNRLSRVEGLILREIADLLLRGDLRDPRLADPATISITGIKVAPDLGSARVFVDVGRAESELREVLAGLNAAASTIRVRIGGQLRLKRIPALRFERDRSIAQGATIERVLAEIHATQAAQATDDPDDSDP